MSQKGKSLLLKYSVTALVGGLMAAGILWLQNFAGAASDLDRVRILSDAFTIPGALLMLCAALVFVSNEGAFDGVGYALSYAISFLVPGAAAYRHERYADYVERKHKKGGVKGYAFLTITGAAFFAVGLILVAVFYFMDG